MHYVSNVERTHHLRAMKELAEELHMDFQKVQEVYEHELVALQRGAKLRDYLPLLTSRHVRVLLRGNA
jgi:hypothetical protein